MKKFKIHFQFTRGWELFFLALMLGSLMALFQETSIFRTEGLSWTPHLVGGVTFSGIATFWVTLVIFHICLFVIIARSVIVEGRTKTSNFLDYSLGFLSILAIYCILISTIYGLYKGTPDIEFLWNIPSILLLRIGFIVNFIVAIYYSVTD